LLIQKYNMANPEWKSFFIPAKVEEKEIEPVIQAYQEIIKVYQHSEVAIEANLRIGILLLHYGNDIAEAENNLKIIIELSNVKICIACFY